MLQYTIILVLLVFLPTGFSTVYDGRLPTSLWPQHYNLRLRPVIDRLTPPFPFNGTVDIFFTCVQATSEIVINSANLNFANLSAISSETSPVPINIVNVTFNFNLQWAIFIVSRQMGVNEKLRLHVEFNGHLRAPGEDGFWWDSYDYKSVTKYMAVTQLEPTSARYMFPLFDEVNMKATFNITVEHHPYHVALANTKLIQKIIVNEAWVADSFATTPIMTPYLVAVAVGEFVYVEATTPPNYPVKLRIYATKKHIDCMRYAAQEVFYKALNFMEKTTSMPFQLDKLDIIAYPRMGGAMENWGLITFSEQIMCIDPQLSSAVSKFTCAKIISHELAHQWYGNMVTNNWWDDMWLHEGFANNYNYYPLEALGWEGSQLQQGDTERGTQQFLDSDAKNTSDPIRKNITTVSQAGDASNGSTYPKGGAILRMIRAIMSRAAMERAFTRYLTKYQYGVVTSDNLYEELSAQAAEEKITYPDGSPLDFKVILEPWLNQMGFPILNVTRSNIDPTKINVLRGEQFLNPSNQNQTESGSFGYKWPIPITVLLQGGNYSDGQEIVPISWIDINSNSANVSIGSVGTGWYLVNAMQNSFFRVNYDENNYARIANQLFTNFKAIPDESRSQIIDDAFTLSKNGYVTVDKIMPLISYISIETSYNPVQSTLKHAQIIYGLIKTEPWYIIYQEYFKELLNPQMNRLGWTFNDSETIQTQFLRTDTIFFSCYFFNTECINTAGDMFANYAVTPDLNTVDPNLLPTVLCTGVLVGLPNSWLLVFMQYNERKDSQIIDERYSYLFALSCSTEADIIKLYFNEIINGSSIASRDLNQAVQYFSSTREGAALMWDYLTQNWNAVNRNIDKFQTIATITSSWKTETDYNTLMQLINSLTNLSNSQYNSLIESALKIQQNIEWFSTNADLLRLWLIRNKPGVPRAYKKERGLPLPLMEPRRALHAAYSRMINVRY